MWVYRTGLGFEPPISKSARTDSCVGRDPIPGQSRYRPCLSQDRVGRTQGKSSAWACSSRRRAARERWSISTLGKLGPREVFDTMPPNLGRLDATSSSMTTSGGTEDVLATSHSRNFSGRCCDGDGS